MGTTILCQCCLLTQPWPSTSVLPPLMRKPKKPGLPQTGGDETPHNTTNVPVIGVSKKWSDLSQSIRKTLCTLCQAPQDLRCCHRRPLVRLPRYPQGLLAPPRRKTTVHLALTWGGRHVHLHLRLRRIFRTDLLDPLLRRGAILNRSTRVSHDDTGIRTTRNPHPMHLHHPTPPTPRLGVPPKWTSWTT